MPAGGAALKSQTPPNGAEAEQRITALVGEFFDRRQAGEALTPEEFAREHQDVAEQLRSHLAGVPLIEQACGLTTGLGGSGSAAVNLPEVPGFELMEEIGRGGMGVVFRARQISTKRIVALKVLLAGPFASSAARRRFEREVELAARLQHPGIVRVLESGEARGQRYYAMDYVAGVRLNQYLATVRPDVPGVLRMFAQLCDALEYAHGHGVIHRDLKPANVLIDEAGQPHILDFGLAKAIDSSDTVAAITADVSCAGQVVGTLFYLSPEQAAGLPERVDGRTDVYSLGVMLFEALTGSLQFDTSGRPSQIIERILEAAPLRPSTMARRVDSDLETIILKALEKEPDRRYAAMRELADDLQRYVAGEPILARRPSRLYVLGKKLRKHRVRAAAGLALVLLAAAALLVGMWEHQRDRERTRWAALECLRRMDERGPRAAEQGWRAQALYERHPSLQETRLVCGRALYLYSETMAPPMTFLERLLSDAGPEQWPSRALLAEVYRAAGDVGRAAALVERVAAEAPDTAEAWYLRSLAALDHANALRCAEECVQRDPSHALAWCRLTWLRNLAGDLEGTLAGADRLMALGRDVEEWTIHKGFVLASHGHLHAAISQFERLIDRGARASPALLYRAHTYRRLGEYERACADYTFLLDHSPERPHDPWFFYQRVVPLWILGRTDEAIADCREFRLRFGRPFYSDARLALILRERGQPDEASAVLERASREVEDPWLQHVYRCLAGELSPDGLIEAAPKDTEHLCEAYYYAAEASLAAGQMDAARMWFQRCVDTELQIDPTAAMLSPMNEYELARWRLKTVFGAGVTSQP